MEIVATAFGYGLTGLVLVGGLVLSIVLWGRAPRAAGLAIGAAALALVALIATVIWVIGAPRLVATEGLSPASVAPLQSAVDLLTAFLSGGSAVLLLAGIFSGRGHRAPRSVR